MPVCLRVMIGFFACLLLAPAPVPAEDMVNRVVAVVGDEVITSLDLEKVVRTIKAQAGASGTKITPEQAKQMEQVALDRLIEDKIFGNEVKRLGLHVTEGEIDRYVDRVKRLNKIDDAAFAAQLSRRGITPEDYRAELKKDILKHKLINQQVKSKIVISDAQIDEYYKKNRADYTKQNEVKLRAIFINVAPDAAPAARDLAKKKAEDIRAQAVDAKTFQELAKKYSQGPGADNGGELGPLSSADLIPEMRLAMSGLKPDEISPVTAAPMGFIIVQLISNSGETMVPVGQVKEDIRTKLTQQATETKFRDWLTELRKSTHVKKIK